MAPPIADSRESGKPGTFSETPDGREDTSRSSPVHSAVARSSYFRFRVFTSVWLASNGKTIGFTVEHRYGLYFVRFASISVATRLMTEVLVGTILQAVVYQRLHRERRVR